MSSLPPTPKTGADSPARPTSVSRPFLSPHSDTGGTARAESPGFLFGGGGASLPVPQAGSPSASPKGRDVVHSTPTHNGGERVDGSVSSQPVVGEGIDNLSTVELRHRLWDALMDVKEKETRIAHMQTTIRELAERLSSVAQFMDLREDIEERLEKMQHAHTEEMAQCKEQLTEARLEMLENRVHLRVVEESVKREHDADVDQRASELLDRRTREVNDQNFLLIKDKLLLSKDVEAARAEAAALSKDNAVLRNQYDLSASTEAELLARSVRQKKEIAALKKQIKTSEDVFSRTIAEFEQRMAADERAHARQIAELSRERDGARNDAKRLHNELVKLRTASTRLVQQRGELEQFFFEALAYVRAQALEDRRRQLLMDTPALNSAFAASHTASSALRLESQKQCLQLTNGKSTLPASSYHNATNMKRRTWGTDAKGLPTLLDNSKNSGKVLPPIPPERAGAAPPSPGGRGPPQAVHSDEEDGDCPQFYDTSAFSASTDGRGGGGLSTIPDAPTWKEIRSVDIKDLSWADKERVIRMLFKRVRQQQNYLSSKRSHEAALVSTTNGGENSTDSGRTTTTLVATTVMHADDDVFVTQQ